MKKNTAGVSTPSLDDNTSSVNDHDEVEPNTPEDFKVILETVFEDSGDRIDTNARSIAKITDLMSRLSTQMTKLMSERNNGSSSIIQVDNNRGSSTNAGSSLVDLTGSPHQYASTLTEFPRFDGDDEKPWSRMRATDISSRFGAPYDDPMAELMELKQTGNVREVNEQFDSYLSRLQLPPQYALRCFMTALNEDISNINMALDFTMFFEALDLTLLEDVVRPFASSLRALVSLPRAAFEALDVTQAQRSVIQSAVAYLIRLGVLFIVENILEAAALPAVNALKQTEAFRMIHKEADVVVPALINNECQLRKTKAKMKSQPKSKNSQEESAVAFEELTTHTSSKNASSSKKTKPSKKDVGTPALRLVKKQFNCEQYYMMAGTYDKMVVYGLDKWDKGTLEMSIGNMGRCGSLFLWLILEVKDLLKGDEVLYVEKSQAM
nr:hypothetical protein [Tanacetum cinerariifolium]